MIDADGGLSLQDRLQRLLDPIGGTFRIDAFLVLMGRERARIAAEERAAQAAAKRAQMESLRAELPEAPQPAAGTEEDEVQAFMNRDQRGDATSDEVSEFMDFMGDAGFDPETMPK